MAFITINVPDNKLDYYTQIFSEYNDITIETDLLDIKTIFTPKFVEMLNERKKEKSLTMEQVKQRIKMKYTEYGL